MYFPLFCPPYTQTCTGSPCAALTGMVLINLVASNLQRSSCLSLQSAEIKGIGLHAWVKTNLKNKRKSKGKPEVLPPSILKRASLYVALNVLEFTAGLELTEIHLS